MISYAKQNISILDYISVIRALSKDYLTQGPAVEEFEDKIKNYTGSNYCLCCNSATSALILAYKAFGLDKGDYFWTTPITFVATSNAALLLGAKVDFLEIKHEDGLIDLHKLKIKLEDAKNNNKLPKIITTVHLYGNTNDMKELRKITQSYGIYLIEDASHALGSIYNNSKVGSCKYSDACIFSFHPVKIITTAEGGCINTNNKEIYKKINYLRSHGITKDQQLFKNNSRNPWEYEQHYLGYNFRLTDLQASLGISQMNRLDRFISKRRKIIKYYKDNLDVNYNKIILESNECKSVYHLAVIQTKNRNHRYDLYNKLKDKGISCQVHYSPVYLQPYYQELGFKKGYLPTAEKFSDRILTIPNYPNLEKKYVKRITNIINELSYKYE